MHDVDPGKFAAQLYGVLADLADGQEVQPSDAAAFLDGAEILLFRDNTPPIPGHGIRVRLATGQILHVTVTAHRDDTRRGEHLMRAQQ